MEPNSKSGVIVQTNYFKSPKTWVFRGVQFSIAVFVLYWVDLAELANASGLMYVCSALLALLFVCLPVDELAVDSKGMYFIKRSLVPFFNSTKTFSASDIKRIGFYTIPHAVSVFTLLVPVSNLARVEFTFKDDSSTSKDIFIRKNDLQNIVSEFRRLQKEG